MGRTLIAVIAYFVRGSLGSAIYCYFAYDGSMFPTRRYDMTVRVGCSLVYQASARSTLMLNIQPFAGNNHQVIFQALSLGNGLHDSPFVDSHGNHVHRVMLEPGTNCIRHDAIVAVSSEPDNTGLRAKHSLTTDAIPSDLLRYAMPSRYCDSDKLADFAWDKFGQIEHGLPRVEAISLWVHNNIEYRYSSGRPDLSAWDILQRGYGVCRDFAHVAIALNRTFNLPARYVTGHLPDIGFPDPNNHMDFHAYAEVYVGGEWFTTDARFHVPRIGRIKIACGQDAVDGAFSTIFGGASLTNFQVWAYQVEHGTVGVGDALDFSRRLDNRMAVHTERPYFVDE